MAASRGSPHRASLADAIVQGVSQAIIAHRLLPGTELDESRLGREFGASRTPVREALRQLAAGGLIELRPHRAPRVAAADPGRIREMFDVMGELEASCAARAAAVMTRAARANVELHHRAMGQCVRDGDVGGYRAGNARFHALIAEGCGNSYLRDLAAATRLRLAPHRGAQLEAAERLPASYAEHERLVRAIVRGDAVGAGAAMRVHLAATLDTLVRLHAAAVTVAA